MAASASDFLTEVGNPGSATSLAAPGHTIAGTIFNVVSTTNWPTTTGVTFAVDQYDTSTAKRVPGTYTEWSGVVASSTQITGASLRYGTDQNYSAGSTTRVYIPVASSRENRLVQGLLSAGLTQAGGMGAITPTSVASTGAVSGTTGTFSGAVSDNGQTLQTIRSEVTFDFVASGCVWTGDALGSTLAASMTSGVVYIGGKRVTVSTVTARAFTASKDTYIDVGNTGTITYTEVANNAASPALAASNIRLGIIVTGAGNIAAAGSVNQGQEDRILPIASSIAYSVTDSLGNLICPRDSQRKTLGYRQITSNFVLSSSQTTPTQVTGLSCPVIVPPARKIKISTSGTTIWNATGNQTSVLSIWDGVVNVGTKLNESDTTNASANGFNNPYTDINTTPATTSKTYNSGISSGGATNVTIAASATAPAYIRIELV